jgi:excisionase family DNA binding protein
MNPAEPLTITVEEAARLFGISRGLAYQAVRDGSIPSISIGRRRLVPRQRLLELVGAPEMREAGRPTSEKPLADENVNGNLTASG